ncbi:Ig-like domain-containing protein [Spirosoma aerolatum]|uniref:Ig-like domain-containing protein n=1 Tax=Spirosoma aerolatum TaxID=1211326 RepID=UPI0009AE5156|nr:hypothetical protein [Spirosoma aerolatum]
MLLLLCGTSQAQQLNVTSVTPTTVCANSSITVSYSYTASDVGTLYLVLSGPDVIIGAASVGGGNGSIQGLIPSNRTAGTYTVRLIRQLANASVINSTNNLSLVINDRPAAPGVSNVAYCVGTTGIQPLTATGQNLTWYPAASGGGGTTTAPTPPTWTTGTTNYYVSQTNGNGCEGPRAALQVTITPPPAKPTVVTSLFYCQNTSALSLAEAVTSGSNLKWYTSALGGTGSAVAPTPSTSDVGSATYYVSQTNYSNQTDGSGCESDRAEITVTIKAAPAAPSATTPMVYCQDAVASPLSATGVSGSSLNWYGPSNNSLGTTVPTPPTTIPGTTFYSVTQTISGCEGPRTTIQLTINSRPVAPTTTPVSVCQNTTPVSLATGITSGSNLKWYTGNTGGTGSTVAPSPATNTIGQTPYYVSQVDGNGCESDRAVLTFIVNGYPAAPMVNPSSLTYCQNTTAASLTAIASTNATLNFYVQPTGGTRFASLIPSTTNSNTYYVSQTLNGCEGPRSTINVQINALPPRPTVTASASYCQSAESLPLSATASINNGLVWYGANVTGGTASTIASSPSTTNAGASFYYVSQKDPLGCESERASIQVIIYAKPAAPTITPISLCLNTPAVSLTTAVTSGSNLKWYSAPIAGMLYGSTPVLSTSAVGSTTYYVSQTNNGCESDRSAVSVTINSLPTVSISSSTTILTCTNQPLSLSAQGEGLVRWSTQETSPSIQVSTSGQYSVTLTDNNSCSAVATTSISSNTALSVSAVSTLSLMNVGAIASLTASGATSYLWIAPSTAPLTTLANASAVSASLTTAGVQTFTVVGTTGVCSQTQFVSVTAVAGPDLSAILSLPNGNFSIGESKGLLVQLQEVNGAVSSGAIVITISVPTGYSVSFDNTLTSLNVSGGSNNPVTIQNNKWHVSNTIAGQQLSLAINGGESIGANTTLKLGLTITRTTANGGSTSNITINVANDGGGIYDVNRLNNIYARIINGL